eukprot:7064279-Alexandrium_andersonii.AAC.1
MPAPRFSLREEQEHTNLRNGSHTPVFGQDGQKALARQTSASRKSVESENKSTPLLGACFLRLGAVVSSSEAFIELLQ